MSNAMKFNPRGGKIDVSFDTGTTNKGVQIITFTDETCLTINIQTFSHRITLIAMRIKRIDSYLPNTSMMNAT